MTNKILSRSVLWGLLVVNVLFFGYYIILSYYSRFHYDDLHFLWKLKEYSIIDYVKEFYSTRSGRFMSYLLNGAIYKTIILTNEHRLFPVLFYLLGILIIWIPTKHILWNLPKALTFNSVLFFYNIYVLTNIDFATFYWLCAMSYYLLAPLLFLLMWLINTRRTTRYIILWVFLISIFLGGGHEAFSPIVITVLFLNALFYFQKHKYNTIETFKDSQFRKIEFAFLIVFVSYIIVIVAPGNYQRMEMLEFKTPGTLHDFLQGYFESISLFLYHIIFYIPYYIIIASLFLFLGFKTKISNTRPLVDSPKYILIGCFAFIVYLILSVTPNVVLWSGFGIQRNYTHIIFTSILLLSFISFLCGYNLKNVKIEILNSKILLVLLAILSVIMISNIYSDSLSARNYAESYDLRIKYMKKTNLKNVRGTIEVDPVKVPNTIDPKYLVYKIIGRKKNFQPVLYYISDTDTIPNEHAFHLQKYYDLNFTVQLKK